MQESLPLMQSLGPTLFTDTRDAVTDMTLGPSLSTESLPHVSSLFTDTELASYMCMELQCMSIQLLYTLAAMRCFNYIRIMTRQQKCTIILLAWLLSILHSKLVRYFTQWNLETLRPLQASGYKVSCIWPDICVYLRK